MGGTAVSLMQAAMSRNPIDAALTKYLGSIVATVVTPDNALTLVGNGKVFAQTPNVAKERAPEISVPDLDLVGPVIAVRPYTHNDHYWQVYFDTNAAILRVAREAGWPAPTPTHNVRTFAGG